MAEFCVNEIHGGMCKKTGTYCNLGACPYEDIKEFAPVVHGRWECSRTSTVDRFAIVKCSACGYEAYAIAEVVKKGNFCPNCGAKMDGGDVLP